jgi:hypothetical protein
MSVLYLDDANNCFLYWLHHLTTRFIFIGLYHESIPATCPIEIKPNDAVDKFLEKHEEFLIF